MKLSLILSLMMMAAASAAELPVKLKVLLITGGHGFETNQFLRMFEENSDITVTPVTQGKTSDAYDRPDFSTFDVVVLYDMVQNITEPQKEKFLALFDRGAGLVVLHHALCSYQEWPRYEQIIGGKYLLKDEQAGGVVTPKSDFRHDMEIPIEIVAKDHPITKGLSDFVIHDEVYFGFRVRDNVTPLITTTFPKSGKPIAWTRTEGKSRLVTLQLGHDHAAWENKNYQTLLKRSIRWVAKKPVE